jgi:hypothetical protein
MKMSVEKITLITFIALLIYGIKKMQTNWHSINLATVSYAKSQRNDQLSDHESRLNLNYRSISSERPIATNRNKSDSLDEVIAQFNLHGDFSNIDSFLSEMSQEEVNQFLVGGLGHLRSRLGNEYDVNGKIALIEKHGIGVNSIAKSKVFMKFGSVIDPVTDLEFIRNLGIDDWRLVAKGLAESGPEKAFKLSRDGLKHDQISVLVTEATATWLDLNSVEASQFISNMAPGYERSLAIEELVNWLNSREEFEMASKWKNLLGVELN